MRRKKDDVNKTVYQSSIDTLFKSAEEAGAKKEFSTFLKEVLTDSEQHMIGRRLLIAQLLMSGMKQAEIQHTLNVSPNTIWKSKKWLKSQFPEYGEFLKSIESERKSKMETGRQIENRSKDPFSFTSLRKKYPMHFLFFNVAEELFKKK